MKNTQIDLSHGASERRVLSSERRVLKPTAVPHAVQKPPKTKARALPRHRTAYFTIFFTSCAPGIAENMEKCGKIFLSPWVPQGSPGIPWGEPWDLRRDLTGRASERRVLTPRGFRTARSEFRTARSEFRTAGSEATGLQNGAF